MTQCLFALYLYQLQVDEAFEELLRYGLPASQMKMFKDIGQLRGGYKIATIGANPEDRFGDMKSELFKSLINWGVPKEEAFVFTEGVRRGGKLAVVFASESETAKVSQILQSHGAVDIEHRKKFAAEKALHPGDPPASPPFTHLVPTSNYQNELADWVYEHRHELGPPVKVRAYDLPPPPPEDKKLERNLNE